MTPTDDSIPIQHSEAFPVKPPVTWVMFPRWPEDGDGWIFPQDRHKAEGLIPSDAIFRREATEDDFYLISYGDVQMKIHPVMMEEIPEPKYKMGEIVELAHQFDVEKISTGTIYAVRWSDYHQEPQYYLIRGDLKSQNAYLAKDLRPYEPPKQFHAMHEYDP